MNQDQVNEAFRVLITKRGIHQKLQISSGYTRTLRYKLRRGIPIGTDTKLALLQRSGWRQDGPSYSRKALLSALSFCIRTSTAAREHGAEYILEKWEMLRGA